MTRAPIDDEPDPTLAGELLVLVLGAAIGSLLTLMILLARYPRLMLAVFHPELFQN